MFDKYKKNKKPILMSIYKNNNMFYKNNIKIDGKLIYDKYDSYINILNLLNFYQKKKLFIYQ